MTAVRNPQLVHISDQLGYIENCGTGIRRMYEAYYSFSQSPQFEVRPNSFKVTLPNVNWNVQAEIVEAQKAKIKQSKVEMARCLCEESTGAPFLGLKRVSQHTFQVSSDPQTDWLLLKKLSLPLCYR